MNEAQLQDKVVAVARHAGWCVMHTRPARTMSGGWATPLQGHKGFPDLVLVHPSRNLLVFAELKSDKGRLEPEQRRWLDALQDAHAIVYVWYPKDWPAIVELLAPGAVIT